MALTPTELFGEIGFADDGATSGGSTFVIAPPTDIATAGALPIIAWVLDRLVQAQTDDGGTPRVVTRTITEQTDGSGSPVTRCQYTVILTAPTAGIAESFAENVIDPFN